MAHGTWPLAVRRAFEDMIVSISPLKMLLLAAVVELAAVHNLLPPGRGMVWRSDNEGADGGQFARALIARHNDAAPCILAGADVYECLATQAASLDAEAELISSFLVFVVRFPRRKQATNTAAYAAQVLAAVHTYYSDRSGRRPGIGDNDTSHSYIGAVIRGLRQLAQARG